MKPDYNIMSNQELKEFREECYSIIRDLYKDKSRIEEQIDWYKSQLDNVELEIKRRGL